MGIENIIFDLDGTLVDSFPGIESSAILAITDVIPQIEIPNLRGFIGPPIRNIFSLALGDLEPETLDELESRFRTNYNSNGWRKSVAYEGVLETLSSLSKLGVRSFVVTNKPIIPTKSILDHLGLSAYIEGVASPDSQEPPFTSKTEALAYIVTRCGIDVGKTLVVGDSSDDARAAHVYNMKFAAVSYGYGGVHLEGISPIHYILSKLSELLIILRPYM